MKEILLSQGRIALVCDCHYEVVRRYKWHYKPDGHGGYASHTENIVRAGKRTTHTFTMHRLIMGEPSGDVDHINLNKLDNRCDNLRLATRKDNCRNIATPGHNTSGYKGVQWRKDRSRWVAGIRVNGIQKRVGSFLTKEEAAIAYNDAAKKYFGEFANLNKAIT